MLSAVNLLTGNNCVWFSSVQILERGNYCVWGKWIGGLRISSAASSWNPLNGRFRRAVPIPSRPPPWRPRCPDQPPATAPPSRKGSSGAPIRYRDTRRGRFPLPSRSRASTSCSHVARSTAPRRPARDRSRALGFLNISQSARLGRLERDLGRRAHRQPRRAGARGLAHGRISDRNSALGPGNRRARPRVAPERGVRQKSATGPPGPGREAGGRGRPWPRWPTPSYRASAQRCCTSATAARPGNAHATRGTDPAREAVRATSGPHPRKPPPRLVRRLRRRGGARLDDATTACLLDGRKSSANSTARRLPRVEVAETAAVEQGAAPPFIRPRTAAVSTSAAASEPSPGPPCGRARPRAQRALSRIVPGDEAGDGRRGAGRGGRAEGERLHAAPASRRGNPRTAAARRRGGPRRCDEAKALRSLRPAALVRGSPDEVAGSAPQRGLHDDVGRAGRTRPPGEVAPRVRGTEHADGGRSDGGRHVHRPRVGGEEEVHGADHRQRVQQGDPAAEVTDLAGESARDFLRQRAVGRAARQEHGPPRTPARAPPLAPRRGPCLIWRPPWRACDEGRRPSSRARGVRPRALAIGLAQRSTRAPAPSPGARRGGDGAAVSAPPGTVASSGTTRVRSRAARVA